MDRQQNAVAGISTRRLRKCSRRRGILPDPERDSASIRRLNAEEMRYGSLDRASINIEGRTSNGKEF
jgi:hypothetical protein